MTSGSETEAHGSRLTSSEKLWLAGVLLLTLLTFASTCTFGWVYDDPPQITGNADLRWDRLGYLFTHHLWSSASGMTEARFYRPLLALWFLVNKTLFGLNPHWFHLTTVLAHVLATALAFLIARKTLKDFGGALLAAAIFGMHPLQAESASWISSVNDSLAASLCFASFLACKQARSERQRAGLWWIAAGVAFVLALLTKEVSAVLPAIVLVDLWFESNGDSAQATKRLSGAMVVAVYGAVGMAWLLLRHHVLGQLAAVTRSAIGWGTILLTAPKIVLFQMYRVILPVGLSPHYDFRPVDTSRILQAFVPLVVLFALALLAVLAARKARSLWIAYAWLFVPLLPSLNLHWVNEDDFVHDRYMYLSLLGVALLAGAGFAELKRRLPLIHMFPLLAAVLVAGLGFASAVQSQYWANDVYLFSRAVRIAPNNEWAQLNYGAALSAREKYAEAAPHFTRSYELKAGWRAADFAGFAYEKSGDLVQAEQWFRLALQMNPMLADAWFGLGQIRLEQQRPAEAVALLQKAITLKPDADGYHYALGVAFEQLSRNTEALEAYQTELQLHPYQTGARKAIERLSAGAPK
ncbi:MAG TPA: tetratricopeptide repeat protein [Candidatus Angelobacter sp.]|nr:tetratricopeptide repeat protein [Candidatus Angelobacter sp.]